MAIMVFLVFLSINQLCINLVLEFSKTHSTLWKNYLAIVLLGVLSGYVFNLFVSPGFFIYFLVLCPVLLVIKYFSIFNSANMLMAMQNSNSVDMNESDKLRIVSAILLAKKEFVIVSLIFIVVFSVSYIGFLNA